MQIVIDDKTYEVRFGVAFMRELDKVFAVTREGVRLGMSLSTKLPALFDGDIATLADILYFGTVTESPRPSQKLIDAYIDQHEDIEALFDAVMAELEASNSGKLLIRKIRDNLAKQA